MQREIKMLRPSALPLYFCRLGSSQGFTLIEVLVAIVVVGVLAAISAPSILHLGNNPLRDGTNKLASQIRMARTRAITETTAYRIRWDMLNPSDPQNVQTQFIVERPSDTAIVKTCSAPNSDWVRDPRFATEDVTTSKKIELYQLRVNGSFPSTVLDPTPATPQDTWTLCIDSRGLADKNIQWTFRLQQGGSGPTQRLEVFPGGIVQVYDDN
jgi:prepilin-type N-terminal cleavage/methylation domain-containing protein